MGRFDRFAIVALLIGIVLSFAGRFADSDRDPLAGRRPLAPTATPAPSPGSGTIAPRTRRTPLAEPSGRDELFNVEVAGPKRSAAGTAFAAGRPGVWMTARHVTEGCSQILIYTPRTRQNGSLALAHGEADLSVLVTGTGGPPLPISEERPLAGQNGFSFGYPQGKLGGTQAQLMGRSRVRLGGRMSGTMPTLTWAETERYPADLEALGGISGGPMLDEAGRVVGIHIASSTRRGRIHTVAPEVVRQVRGDPRFAARPLAETPVNGLDAPHPSLQSIVDGLFRSGRIARVYCAVS